MYLFSLLIISILIFSVDIAILNCITISLLSSFRTIVPRRFPAFFRRSSPVARATQRKRPLVFHLSVSGQNNNYVNLSTPKDKHVGDDFATVCSLTIYFFPPLVGVVLLLWKSRSVLGHPKKLIIN